MLSTRKFLFPNDGSRSTAIAIGGSLIGYAKVVLETMRSFAWRQATILVEMKTIITFYQDLSKQLMDSAAAAESFFRLEMYPLVDDSNDTLYAGLRFAKQRSRGSNSLACGLF